MTTPIIKTTTKNQIKTDQDKKEQNEINNPKTKPKTNQDNKGQNKTTGINKPTYRIFL